MTDLLILLYILVAGVGIVCAYALWLLAWRLIPMFMGGAPWVPSDPRNVQTMIELAGLRSGDRVVDLGSGDGRIVLAAALSGTRESVGYELDPTLVKYCIKKAKRLGFANARFERRDFWKTDLSAFDVVFLFQIPFAMRRLEKKLRRELKPGSRVVSNSFTFPTLTPATSFGTVRLYIV